jgi:tyrosyl-tRNA synthetase
MDIAKQLEVIKRGVVELIPEDELVKKLQKGKPLRVKWGADPSAPDIHLGHTVILRKLRALQDFGHEVIFLIGDFTAMIGDPSGKSETRKPLTKDQVKKNAGTYKDQVFKILDKKRTKVVFNSDWLKRLTMEDVINLAGKYTVARMLERDDFMNRFEKERPISIHEFLYPLIQGYDSVELKSDIEIGGTDQKFNLLVGRELQREFKEEPQIILTMPLLEGLDGVQKMSKSLNNYIGVTESPKDMFGKTMSIPDNLLVKYYELLTDVPLDEIKKMKVEMDFGKLNPRNAKARLGGIIVEQYHGVQAAEEASREFDSVFKNKSIPTDIPVLEISRSELDADGSIGMIKLLAVSGLCSSSSEAKRVIVQGGVRVDGQGVKDEKVRVKLDKEMLINVGKLKYARVRLK